LSNPDGMKGGSHQATELKRGGARGAAPWERRGSVKAVLLTKGVEEGTEGGGEGGGVKKWRGSEYGLPKGVSHKEERDKLRGTQR